MNRVGRILLFVLSILYPAVVFLSLYFFRASSHLVVFSVFFLAILFFLLRIKPQEMTGFTKYQTLLMLVVLSGFFIAAIATDQIGLVKLYPVLMNLFLLSGFAFSLWRGPNMIFKFAMLQDKSLVGSEKEAAVLKYCRTVTKAWCWFFLANAAVALWTTFFASDLIWAVWNGLLSYVFIGIFFVVEVLIRKRVMVRQ